jgi:NitT/TauT family transport system substrate-binding protein
MADSAPRANQTPPRGKIAIIGLSGLLALGLLIYLGFAGQRGEPIPIAAQRTTIAVNGNFLGSSLVHIANAEQFFRRHGADVIVKDYPSGQASLDAALKGEADFATVADTPLMFAIMDGRPVSIVATISRQSNNGIIARRDRGVVTVDDLKHKKIGLRLGTISHYLLYALLLSRNMDLSDTELVDTAPDQLERSIRDGAVDAVTTWDPYLGQIKAALATNAVSIPADEPYTFNLASRTEYIKNNRPAVEAVLASLIEAQRFASLSPETSKSVVTAASGIDPKEVNADWAQFDLQVTLDQSLIAQLEDQARWAIKTSHEKYRQMPNFLNSIATEPLAAVQRAAVTIIR